MAQGARGVALVTGAAGGIGSAVVSTLRARGYTVVGTDRAPRDDVRVLDITDGDAVAEFVARVEDDEGPVEVLVNAAGLLRTAPALADDDDLVALVAVNVLGTATLTRAVVRRMVARGRGSVVTVASNAARVPRTGMAAYGASKAALTAWTKSLGLEVAEHGVRCNVVHPGTTRTPMLGDLGDTEQVVAAAIAGTPEAYKVGIPLRRVAEPEDVAAAVAFLASDEARHLTMHELYVDGGASLR